MLYYKSGRQILLICQRQQQPVAADMAGLPRIHLKMLFNLHDRQICHLEVRQTQEFECLWSSTVVAIVLRLDCNEGAVGMLE